MQFGQFSIVCSFYHVIFLSSGVATDAKVGSDLIKVLALDADVGNNSLVFYSILGIHYIKQNSNDSKAVKNIFVIGKGNHFIHNILHSLRVKATLKWDFSFL